MLLFRQLVRNEDIFVDIWHLKEMEKNRICTNLLFKFFLNNKNSICFYGRWVCIASTLLGKAINYSYLLKIYILIIIKCLYVSVLRICFFRSIQHAGLDTTTDHTTQQGRSTIHNRCIQASKTSQKNYKSKL